MQMLERQPLFDALYDALDATGDERLRLHENYSGRGMYGRECIGISADSLSAINVLLIRLATAYDEDVATSMAEAMRTDGFGKGMIAYFPGFQLKEEDDAS